MMTAMPDLPDASPSAPSRLRRQGVTAAIALAASLAGVGWGVWRQREQVAAEPLAGADRVPPAVWAQSFDRLGGGGFSLDSLRGQALLLNFWATWCPPCIEEFPLLDRFHRQSQPKGPVVLGLAVDRPSAVQSFLQSHPVGFRIALAGMEGSALAQQLGNTSNGLPFTVLIDANGIILARKMGKISQEELASWSELLARRT